MLPKKTRLISSEVSAVTKGRVLHTKFFTIRHLPSSIETPKVSIIVSKKIARQAVVRNALKRKGYTAVEPFFSTVSRGLYAIFLKKEGVDLSVEELSNEIKVSLKQANLL